MVWAEETHVETSWFQREPVSSWFQPGLEGSFLEVTSWFQREPFPSWFHPGLGGSFLEENSRLFRDYFNPGLIVIWQEVSSRNLPDFSTAFFTLV